MKFEFAIFFINYAIFFSVKIEKSYIFAIGPIFSSSRYSVTFRLHGHVDVWYVY